MPAFPKPSFPYIAHADKEIKNLIDYKNSKPGRNIPEKSSKKLLLATWNIANLGLQKRTDIHYQIIASMLLWFDIIAIQEVNDNIEGLRGIQKHLPSNYKVLFSDKAGNNERMAFIYDTHKLSFGEKVGEIAVPPEEYEQIKLPGVKYKFKGFNRYPFIASFQAENFDFLLANVHLYFGKDKDKSSMERRSLETYCVARWADLRRKSKYAYSKNIIALGDFNLPKVAPDDPIYKALSAKGLVLPEHSSKVYSNIANDKAYDQIAFFPGLKERLSGNMGVFDFDGALFPDLYKKVTPVKFAAYLRYYISDHRPKWLEINL